MSSRLPKLLPPGVLVEVIRHRSLARGGLVEVAPGDRGVIVKVSEHGYAVDVGGVVVVLLHSDVVLVRLPAP